MILLIDNYDSFSYNLYQLVGTINPDIKVIRNDEMTPAEVKTLFPERIILSPGPGRPENAGICEDIVRTFEGKIPILGVCLGHQAICQVYGAEITYAHQLMHGKQSEISVDENCVIFRGLGPKVQGARYHSLAADPGTIPDVLQIAGKADDGDIMAVKHREYDVYGLQFHPESILTPDGKQILENFLNI